jgi:predicted alpha/beta superfamily hydrolase
MRTSLVAFSIALGLVVAGCPGPAASGDAGSGSDAGRDAGTLDANGGDAASDAGSDASGDAGADGAVDASRDTATVHVVYPSGHAITVRGAGGGLSWTSGTAATDLGGGVYELVLRGLSAPIELKPLLDDTTWSRGANYHVAPGDRIEIAPHFTATSGHVETLLPSWSPASLGNDRAIYVYYPAAYDENTAARFPVLYMHDGQNLFDAALAFGGNEWQVDETMDASGEGGACPDGSACASDGDCGGARCDTFGDTLVIGIANTAARIDEYTQTADPMYGGGHADAYLDAITGDLVPQVNAMLRTRTGASETALMGSSLGGLVSSYAGITRGGTFGRIGAMSPSTWWDSRVLIAEVATIPMHAPRALRVYVDSGDSGASNDDVTDTADLAAAYRAVGYAEGTDFHYVVQPGGQHNEVYWAMRLPAALRFLLAPRERAF